MWRNEKPHALLVRMQNGTVTVENSMERPQKIKIDHVIKQSHYWVYTQTKRKQSLEEMSVHPCSQQHYSQELKRGSNPSAPQHLKG